MAGMIERIARVLCSEEYGSDDAEYIGKPLWKNYANTARIIIKAMRDPTDKMLCNMDRYSDLIGPYPEVNTKKERLRQFESAYKSAIDAAIDEGE